MTNLDLNTDQHSPRRTSTGNPEIKWARRIAYPAIKAFLEAKFVRNESSANTNVGVRLVDLPIQLDNPFVPESVRSQFDSLTSQSLDPQLVVSRNFVDAATTGPVETKRDTFRIIGGFEGELSKTFSYEFSLNYGRTDTDVVNNAEGLLDRFYAATDVIADPSTGEPICRSDIDPNALPSTGLLPSLFAPGFRTFSAGDGSCVPLNVFAEPNGLNPAAIDFIFQRAEDSFQLEQFVVNATFSGNFENFLYLPAGAISYAAGLEYRDESSSFSPDSLKVNRFGTFQQFGFDPTGGSFNVVEGFAEVSVPVIADAPLIKSLQFDSSVRVADYSTVGTVTSYGFGAIWRPTEDIRLRGSFNRAVRAPNISELFKTRDVFLNAIPEGSDPCDPNSIAAGSPTRAENCAQLIPNLDTFDPSPAYNFPGFEIAFGGNPDLDAEVADTWTIGAVLTPSFLPGLTIIADYYDIDISNAVTSAGRFAILDNCVDAATIDNPFCDATRRNATTGVIEFVDESLINAANSRSKGIDYQLNYSFNLDRLFSNFIGEFQLNLAGSYLMKREEQTAAGFPESVNRLDGEIDFPRHFTNASLGWAKDRVSAVYGVTYQSNVVFGPGPIGREEIEADPFLLDRPDLGSAFVHFLGATYQINDALKVSLRANNLLDRDPFKLTNGFRDPIRPVSFLGRTVQLSAQAKF